MHSTTNPSKLVRYSTAEGLICAQSLVETAALSNAFARSNLMDAQASGQLPPRQEAGGLHSKRSSRDYSQMDSQSSDLRRHYHAFSSQASSQLEVPPRIPDGYPVHQVLRV